MILLALSLTAVSSPVSSNIVVEVQLFEWRGKHSQFPESEEIYLLVLKNLAAKTDMKKLNRAIQSLLAHY